MSGTKIKDRDYLAVSASVRAREAKMLSREKKERMIDAPSFEEAAKLLLDCGYEDMSGMDAQQIEKALSERRARIFEDVEKQVAEKEIVEAFRLKYDYHNAKVLIKAEGADVDGAYLLSGSGNISPTQFTDAFLSRDYRYIPVQIAQAVAEARSVLNKTENPQLADFILDKAYYAELLKMSERLYSPFLSDYVQTLIDSANLGAAVRCARMGKDMSFFFKAMIAGGKLDAAVLAHVAIAGEGFASCLGGTAFAATAEYADAAATGGSLMAFELSVKKVLAEFFERASLTSFGSEPVIVYLAKTENEITAVRMILTGKLSGVDPKLLRERLGD